METTSNQDEPTIVQTLRTLAERSPRRTLYTFLDASGNERDRITAEELDRRARAIAVHLRDVAPAGGRALLAFPAGL